MLRFKLKLLLTLFVVMSCYQTCLSDSGKVKQEVKKTYIVHMDKSSKPESFDDHLHWYDTSLKSVSDSADMLYTYSNVIHGFSTSLTDEEAKALRGRQGILSVLPEVIYELHTTRSPEFLGLGTRDALWPQSGSMSEVIIGVLDTGVWPDSKSYDDTGLGPVPRTWRGACEVGKNFNSTSCNRKLIGARFFSKGYESAAGPIDETLESRSPRDDDGHGTHTSTTAAGSAVSGANFFGYASGTARGMASSARVATYKICWSGGCFSTDILAAIDKAIEDGVNVLSMSIGGGASDYQRDNVAIGTFAAMEHGILVSCSAGNNGPTHGGLSNVAPWITTVGASTLDRDFPSYIILGNGKSVSGVSLYSGRQLADTLPLVYAANASKSAIGYLCYSGSLDPVKVAGKIVVCDRGLNSRVEKGMIVKSAGGLGMILANTEEQGEELVADSHVIPAAAVGQKAGELIKRYLASDPKAMAKIIFSGTKLGVQPSPVVAAFSSRGPNYVTPEILKPDLIAPGVNILAGWTGAAAPTGLGSDKRRVSFNIASGTSMSCPHVSGLAALVKAAHPQWSPAAIKSALMTTAYTTYTNGQTIEDVSNGAACTPFDYGAGHVNPVAALDPGLVYDTSADDYLGFLCALNYTTIQIKQIAKRDFSCNSGKRYRVQDLNYPSFAVPLETLLESNRDTKDTTTTVKYSRTLTNVGSPGTYKVLVSSQESLVKVLVEPQILNFSELNEKKTYTVTFVASSMPSGTIGFARIEWSDGKHIVSSPIAFSWT